MAVVKMAVEQRACDGTLAGAFCVSKQANMFINEYLDWVDVVRPRGPLVVADPAGVADPDPRVSHYLDLERDRNEETGDRPTTAEHLNLTKPVFRLVPISASQHHFGRVAEVVGADAQDDEVRLEPADVFQQRGCCQYCPAEAPMCPCIQQ